MKKDSEVQVYDEATDNLTGNIKINLISYFLCNRLMDYSNIPPLNSELSAKKSEKITPSVLECESHEI